jgi:hypothetical protein
MMRRILPILALVVCLGPVFAQTGDVFAPFVSRLKVTAEGSAIRLTWKDTRDVPAGSYAIYRHTEEITAENFSEAVKLGEVAPGTESFLDKPEDKRPYYYAVLAKDATGKLYELFILFRNKTITGVAVETLDTVEELAARITDISTTVEGDSITVTFDSSKDERDLLVYRNTAPIRSSSDLAFSQSLRGLPSSKTSFQDFPVPGISYYYAVIDSAFIKVGDIEFTPGENTTIVPAMIPLGARVGLPATTVNRSLPLPLHLLTSSIEDGSDLPLGDYIRVPEYQELDSATTKAVNGLLSGLPKTAPVAPEPTILPEDRGSVVSGGEEYTLKSILTREFAEERWIETESLLKKYLSVHRSAHIELRARFYLGQTLFFQEKYREALLEFVLVRDQLYARVEPWLDVIFHRIDGDFDG